jgi:hypothetical protein
MADQLLSEVVDDEDGAARLSDFAMGCFGLQRWKVGLRIAYAVRARSAKHDRQLRFWALREIVNWSPLLDPNRPWPPPEVPAILHADLDVVALLVFGLDGHPDSWRDDPRLAGVARTVVEAINQPWRMVR